MSTSDDDKDFDSLPVEDFKDEILAAIESHQIIVCLGETGSGKTTKIPQFCADIPGVSRIAVTQPRRVAAISVSERVAAERGCAVGTEVGYTIRFDDMSHPEKTRIKFMTDGVLVRECLSDPAMSRYQAVMLDEAHERSIHTDILFALLKQACKRRRDLKLVSRLLNHGSLFKNCLSL
jgi:ATP-dependent RNA helicase DHX8/PRP22